MKAIVTLFLAVALVAAPQSGLGAPLVRRRVRRSEAAEDHGHVDQGGLDEPAHLVLTWTSRIPMAPRQPGRSRAVRPVNCSGAASPRISSWWVGGQRRRLQGQGRIQQRVRPARHLSGRPQCVHGDRPGRPRAGALRQEDHMRRISVRWLLLALVAVCPCRNGYSTQRRLGDFVPQRQPKG